MRKERTIFDFTNRELSEIAEEYIKLKLKRDFWGVDRTVKKNQEMQTVELIAKVRDKGDREYTFKFYFCNYYIECFVDGGLMKYPVKENTNDSLELMEFMLYHYGMLAGIGYVDKFRDYQLKRAETSYQEEKQKGRDHIELKNIKTTYTANKEKITAMCARVLEKLSINV